MTVKLFARGLGIALAAALLAAPSASPAHSGGGHGGGGHHGGGHADCDVELFGLAEFEDGVLAVEGVAFEGSGIVITPNDELLFEELEELGTEYNLTDDGAGGGSPRFQVALDEDGDGDADGNVFVYIGTPPNFDDDPSGWEDTGNLLESTDTRFDTTQFGGPFFGTYAQAVALVGELPIVDIALVVDGGWFQSDGEQTVLFDDIRVHDCQIEDEDEDGVPSPIDQCPDSDLRPFVDVNGSQSGQTSVPNTVDEDGCSIQDLVNKAARGVRNHGQYVSAIAHLADQLRRDGIITSGQANELKVGAARSSIGKGGDDDDDDDDDGKGKGKDKGGKGKGKGGKKK
jgi:hypothetical protein